jgi:hypothetical protein
MPRAARGVGEIEEYQRMLQGLEAETDSTLDQFVASAENALGFYATMEKVESQLAAAERLQKAENDLQLNESVVIAEKLENEIASAEKFAACAAISETQEEWAESFEEARSALDRMSLQLRKARAGNAAGEPLEVRSALAAFKRDAAKFKKRLATLTSCISRRKSPAHAKVSLAKARLARLKAGVGETLSKIARSRLRRRIAEAHGEIEGFLAQTQNGRIVVDHKHLTLRSGRHSTRMPLTEAVGFALTDLAPQMKKSLAKVAKGEAHLVGNYESAAQGRVLRIGERAVSGDTIVYRERSFCI